MEPAYVLKLADFRANSADGEAPFMGGFMPTSNHLAPDNPGGTVRVITDGPVYWTVELQSDEVRQKNVIQT